MFIVKCKQCGTEINSNTKKEMVSCECKAVKVDGCEEYVRVLGDPEKYERIKTPESGRFPA